MIQIRCYDQGRDDAIIEPEKYQNFYIEYDQIVPDKIASYCFNLFKTDVDKLYLRSRKELKRKCKHRTELTAQTVLPESIINPRRVSVNFSHNLVAFVVISDPRSSSN